MVGLTWLTAVISWRYPLEKIAALDLRGSRAKHGHLAICNRVCLLYYDCYIPGINHHLTQVTFSFLAPTLPTKVAPTPAPRTDAQFMPHTTAWPRVTCTISTMRIVASCGLPHTCGKRGSRMKRAGCGMAMAPRCLRSRVNSRYWRSVNLGCKSVGV